MFQSVRPRLENLKKHYHIERISTNPDDLGFFPVTRERYYFILIHREYGQFIQSAASLYEEIAKAYKNARTMTIHDMFWESDPDSLEHEKRLSWTEGRLSQGDTSWYGLLTPWEKEQLETYKKTWLSNHSSFENAVFALSQSATKRPTMTTVHNALPTLFLYNVQIQEFSPFTQSVCHLCVSSKTMYIHIYIYLYVYLIYFFLFG